MNSAHTGKALLREVIQDSIAWARLGGFTITAEDECGKYPLKRRGAGAMGVVPAKYEKALYCID